MGAKRFLRKRPGPTALHCIPNVYPAALPDHLFGEGAFPDHKSKPGHIRAALAPFQAHAFLKRSNEQYKWMLYGGYAPRIQARRHTHIHSHLFHPLPPTAHPSGDDDTLFYLPNVLKLLKRLDHYEPLALSDNLWCGPRPSQRPDPAAGSPPGEHDTAAGRTLMMDGSGRSIHGTTSASASRALTLTPPIPPPVRGLPQVPAQGRQEHAPAPRRPALLLLRSLR